MNKFNDYNKTVEFISNSSSKINIIMALFITYCFYILIVSLNITDLDLFIDGSTVTVPVLNFKIKLSTFYYGAPLILFILYLNLYTSFKQYQKSINEIKGSQKDIEVYVIPFLFNRRDTISNLIQYLILIILPLTVLLVLLFKLLAYQEVNVTIFHFIIFLLMSITAYFFNKTIFNIKTTYFNIYTIVCSSIILINIYILDQINSLNIIKDEIIKSLVIDYFKENLSLKINNYDFNIENIRTLYGNPSINFNFNVRNLKYLEFKGSKIKNANFKYSNLHHANFKQSNLEKVYFGGATMPYANFILSNMKDVKFMSEINVYQNGLSKVFFRTESKKNFLHINFGGATFENVFLGYFDAIRYAHFMSNKFTNTILYKDGMQEYIVEKVENNNFFLKKIQ